MHESLPEGSGAVLLIHDRTDAVVAGRVELALTRTARRVGLCGRRQFESDAALVLAPCFAIHTAFMRFAIDVLFVDRHGCVLRTVHRLKPWRVAVSPRAYAVVELAAGTLGRYRVEKGDRCHLTTAAPEGSGRVRQPHQIGDLRPC